jgi:hypothetical protein
LDKSSFIRGGEFTYKLKKRKKLEGQLVAYILYDGRILERIELQNKKGSFSLKKYWFHPYEQLFEIKIQEILPPYNVENYVTSITISPAEEEIWTKPKSSLKYTKLKQLVIMKKKTGK